MSESMPDLHDILSAVDDFAVTLMFETFLRHAPDFDLDPDTLSSALGSYRPDLPFDEVVGWIDDDILSETSLGRDASARFCREILALAATRPELREVVRRAILHPDDRRLQAGVSMKLGALATALMLVASTSFKIKIGESVIEKDALTAETIVALADLVKSIRIELPPLSHDKHR